MPRELLVAQRENIRQKLAGNLGTFWADFPIVNVRKARKEK